MGRFRARESRRVFDVSVHVGVLGGPRDSFVVRAQDLPAVDAALRTDVVARAASRTPRRRGAPRGWCVPALRSRTTWTCSGSRRRRRPSAMHGRTLEAFFALTRAGWRDVLSDESRVWKRLRL